MNPGTSELLNQSPPYEDIDLFAGDLPLQQAVAANGAAREDEGGAAFGRRLGSADMLEQGRLPDGNAPDALTLVATGRLPGVLALRLAYHRPPRVSNIAWVPTAH